MEPRMALATSIFATPLSQPWGVDFSKSPALKASVSQGRGYEIAMKKFLPIDGSCVEDSGHTWAWRITYGQSANIALV